MTSQLERLTGAGKPLAAEPPALLTSSSPRLDAIGRQVGMPTGHPNSTVPTIRLSSRGSAFSHGSGATAPIRSTTRRDSLSPRQSARNDQCFG